MCLLGAFPYISLLIVKAFLCGRFIHSNLPTSPVFLTERKNKRYIDGEVDKRRVKEMFQRGLFHLGSFKLCHLK